MKDEIATAVGGSLGALRGRVVWVIIARDPAELPTPLDRGVFALPPHVERHAGTIEYLRRDAITSAT